MGRGGHNAAEQWTGHRGPDPKFCPLALLLGTCGGRTPFFLVFKLCLLCVVSSVLVSKGCTDILLCRWAEVAITLLNNGLDIEALPLSVRLRKPHEFAMATHDAQVGSFWQLLACSWDQASQTRPDRIMACMRTGLKTQPSGWPCVWACIATWQCQLRCCLRAFASCMTSPWPPTMLRWAASGKGGAWDQTPQTRPHLACVQSGLRYLLVWRQLTSDLPCSSAVPAQVLSVRLRKPHEYAKGPHDAQVGSLQASWDQPSQTRPDHGMPVMWPQNPGFCVAVHVGPRCHLAMPAQCCLCACTSPTSLPWPPRLLKRTTGTASNQVHSAARGLLIKSTCL